MSLHLPGERKRFLHTLASLGIILHMAPLYQAGSLYPPFFCCCSFASLSVYLLLHGFYLPQESSLISQLISVLNLLRNFLYQSLAVKVINHLALQLLGLGGIK